MQERIPMDPSSLSQSLKPLGLMENMLSSVLTHHIALPSHYLHVFNSGEVVEGMDVVKKIEGLGSESGKVSKTVIIADSGLV